MKMASTFSSAIARCDFCALFVTARSLAVLSALLMGGAATAQEPWNGPRPSGMTQAHDRYAASALEVFNRLGRDFNGNPNDFHDETWTWQNGRNGLSPLSNMDSATIGSVITGRYFVYSMFLYPEYWSVIYHAPDGVSHYCLAQGGGSYAEYSLDRYVNKAVFGLSGVLYWDPETERTRRPNLRRNYGWPMVGDGRTGRIAVYGWDDGSWSTNIGWVQSAYAAAFAEHCPNLPRVAEVNTAQTGRSADDLRRNARAVGFPTAFESDPADPLTVNMFYWANPPQ
ncbi:hypothetical protein M3N55_15410 [Roseibaca sp. V10]|uniref:Uncharacterized protein n=1 Tax=Roseinatronobacter domitianus TaxID=2940293 RepID=A0ABT0M644_9RHOB|nr:hypothetical protein [Roseibaca domitiana]MCL1630113.1 hypothetical protein [Roseibaca domitiana]